MAMTCLLAAAGQAAGRVAPDAPAAKMPPQIGAGQDGWSYGRADSPTIRDKARKILSSSRFAEKWSFQKWLAQQIQKLMSSLSDLSTAGHVVFWIVIVWCVLALLAILAHAVWTIYLACRRTRSAPRPMLSSISERFGQFAGMTYEQLLAEMERLAGAGEFGQAMVAMMLALLRRLEAVSLLSLHESKSNGDYVREYPQSRPERADFQRFVRSFDVAAYGGFSCNGNYFSQMKSLFQQVTSHAS